MGRHSPAAIPVDLRARLEAARLDLLALFRALDRMNLTPSEIPQRLIRQLFELDADYVEALWGLDQPPGNPQSGCHAAGYPRSIGTTTRILFPASQQPPAKISRRPLTTGSLYPHQTQSR